MLQVMHRHVHKSLECHNGFFERARLHHTEHLKVRMFVSVYGVGRLFQTLQIPCLHTQKSPLDGGLYVSLGRTMPWSARTLGIRYISVKHFYANPFLLIPSSTFDLADNKAAS